MAGCMEDSVLLINEETNDDDCLLQDVNVHPQRRRAGIAPPLPPGKRYHAFFSHCREDDRWVRNLLDRLEAPENGFRCCIADRDFDLGVPVFENIDRSIQSSCKTVIVMSPDFLNSQWCSYEAQITMEQDIDLRRRLLVPIMLRQCAVPEFIGRLTYIDVNNQHFWARLTDALRDVEEFVTNDERLEPTGRRARLMAIPFHFNPNYHNGQLITTLIAFSIVISWRSQLENPLIPESLVSGGIQMNPQDYHSIARQLRSTVYVRVHSCCSSSCITLLMVLLVAVCLVCVTLCMPLCTSFHWPTGVQGFVMWFTPMSFALLVLTLICKCRCEVIRRYAKTLREVNAITSRSNVLVCSKVHGCMTRYPYRLAMSFYYYEWRSCELHLRDWLQDREESTETTDLQEFARNLLLDHSLEYGQLLIRQRLAIPSEQRHNRQGECMCQFVERTLQEKRGCLSACRCV